MIGKSHLVQAIGREVLKAGYLVLYRSIFDLVRELLSQETQLGEGRLLNKYLKPDLLIIYHRRHGPQNPPAKKRRDPPGNYHAPLREPFDHDELQSSH